MNVDFNYKEIERLTTVDLANEIKSDVERVKNSFVGKMDALSIKNLEDSVIVGFFTGSLVYIYRYDRELKTGRKRIISIADYWFMKDLLSGSWAETLK